MQIRQLMKNKRKNSLLKSLILRTTLDCDLLSIVYKPKDNPLPLFWFAVQPDRCVYGLLHYGLIVMDFDRNNHYHH